MPPARPLSGSLDGGANYDSGNEVDDQEYDELAMKQLQDSLLLNEDNDGDENSETPDTTNDVGSNSPMPAKKLTGSLFFKSVNENNDEMHTQTEYTTTNMNLELTSPTATDERHSSTQLPNGFTPLTSSRSVRAVRSAPTSATRGDLMEFDSAQRADQPRLPWKWPLSGKKIREPYKPTVVGKWWYVWGQENCEDWITVSNVARIMETEMGIQLFGHERCTRCQKDGLECWKYTGRATMHVKYPGSACARCRAVPRNIGCSLAKRRSNRLTGRIETSISPPLSWNRVLLPRKGPTTEDLTTDVSKDGGE